MTAGHVRIERRPYDDSLISVGDEYLGRNGEMLRVVRETHIRRQSLLTRIMDGITFGLWPFGKNVRVPVLKEDRMREQ